MVRNNCDIQGLNEALRLYEGASSEALWCVPGGSSLPDLSENVKWGKSGIQFLRVYLGNDEYRLTHWEGLVEGVLVKLSKWKWLLPQLSYRGRVLIANNLIASTLWHKLVVLGPPSIVMSLGGVLLDGLTVYRLYRFQENGMDPISGYMMSLCFKPSYLC